MQSIKSTIKSALPQFVREALERRRRAEYRTMTTQEVFSKIYRDGVWGQPVNGVDRFYSGTGSHDSTITSAYVQAVSKFLGSFEQKPDVVDLGCGDFEIGSQLRPYCRQYVACDIVEPLINFNRQKYKGLDVDFRVLDLSRDRLPLGKIAFIRQVLQHLSNEKIQASLAQLSVVYDYLVVTEHLPTALDFTPNLDKETGPDNRVKFNSGVILTSPPFDLRPIHSWNICELAEDSGVIVTTVLRMR